MQFLKILFWCLLAFVAALFTYGNWGSVPVQLWSGMIADVNLPFLLLLTFLAGLVPTALLGGAQRWRLRQRLAQAERTADALRSAAQAPIPVPSSAPPPLGALPTTMPPGGA